MKVFGFEIGCFFSFDWLLIINKLLSELNLIFNELLLLNVFDSF
jgi:hypothetical protein